MTARTVRTRRAAGWGCVLLLAGCRDAPPDPPASAPPPLEQAAIARGLVRDPAGREPGGLYARDGDRLCVVAGGGGYRIGAVVDYGQGIACTATGVATRTDEGIRVAFGDSGDDDTGDCTFDAVHEGERIAFPGRLPDGCRRFCRSRASLAALDVVRLSDSASEAGALRDARGRALCGDEE